MAKKNKTIDQAQQLAEIFRGLGIVGGQAVQSPAGQKAVSLGADALKNPTPLGILSTLVQKQVSNAAPDAMNLLSNLIAQASNIPSQQKLEGAVRGTKTEQAVAQKNAQENIIPDQSIDEKLLPPLQQNALKTAKSIQSKQMEEAAQAGVPIENMLEQAGVPVSQPQSIEQKRNQLVQEVRMNRDEVNNIGRGLLSRLLNMDLSPDVTATALNNELVRRELRTGQTSNQSLKEKAIKQLGGVENLSEKQQKILAGLESSSDNKITTKDLEVLADIEDVDVGFLEGLFGETRIKKLLKGNPSLAKKFQEQFGVDTNLETLSGKLEEKVRKISDEGMNQAIQALQENGLPVNEKNIAEAARQLGLK